MVVLVVRSKAARPFDKVPRSWLLELSRSASLDPLGLPWRRGRRVTSWLRGVLFPWPAAVARGDGDLAKLSSCFLVLVLSQATAVALLQCSASLVEV
jgi:hypothetical protein